MNPQTPPVDDNRLLQDRWRGLSSAEIRHQRLVGFLRHLIAQSVVSPSAMSRAQAAAAQTSTPAHRALVQLGLVAESALAKAMSDFLRYPIRDDVSHYTASILEDRIPATFVRTKQVLPLAINDSGSELVLAVVDPFDREPIDAVSYVTGASVAVELLTEANVARLYERLYGAPSTGAASRDHKTHDLVDDADVEKLRGTASQAPIIKFVDEILDQAVADKASDIHVEST